ncbi:MAG: nucleotidyltransferase family protein [Ruminococcus sp.]
MTDSTIVKYGKYLTDVISSVINGTAPSLPFDGFDWERFYRLAYFHNVAVLAYPAVKDFAMPAEVLEKFQKDHYKKLAREAKMEIEAQQLFSALSAAGYDYIKMKGIVIKNLYPAPYMRTFSDIDICLSKEDRESAKTLMADMGYTLETTIPYHDEYEKNKYYYIELHSLIVHERSPFFAMFENPFEKSIRDGADEHSYVLKDEYFYLHLLVHLRKHFATEGCGIRLFTDLYVFRKHHPDLDMDFVSQLVEEYGLTDFYRSINDMLLCFFEQKEMTENEEIIAEFVFRSGEHGDAEVKKLTRVSADRPSKLTFWDKTKYFFGNWFGYDVLKNIYPILEKAPILLPVCWVRRIFRTLIFRRHSLKAQSELIKNMNSDKIKKANLAQELAGVINKQ